jgi:hypothetical protein
MNSLFRAAALAALLTVGLSTATQAQTPKMPTAPSISLQWLKSLTINPDTVTNVGSATGTVTLLRPAIKDMAIELSIVGGYLDEAFSTLNGVIIFNRVFVRAGTDRIDFAFMGSTGLGTLTVAARYGQESRTATLTIVPLKKPGSRP